MIEAPWQLSPWLRVATIFVAIGAVAPAFVRYWPEIVIMLPIWARMGTETAILLAGAIALAALAAALVPRRQGYRDGNE